MHGRLAGAGDRPAGPTGPDNVRASLRRKPLHNGGKRDEEELLPAHQPGPCGLPRASAARPVRAAVGPHRRKAGANRLGQAQGGGADHRHPVLQHPDREPPGRDQRHPAAPRPRPVEPRPPEGGAARGARPPRGGPRPPRAPAQRAGHRPQGAGRPAGGDLQGRHARRAHGDARRRRLRRPARARRVPRPHLRPGPRDHRRGARPARPGPRPGRGAGRPGGARATRRRAHPARARPDRPGAGPAPVLARPARLSARRQARRAGPGAGQQGGASRAT